jgi:2-dehydropantoate 2-reductase
MSTKRLLIVGCGAIGGIYAAHLSRLAEVIALDANAAHVAAINRDGLRLTGVSDFVARVRAENSPGALRGERLDAVIVLVKSQFTASAFAAVTPMLAGAPLVVTLQNGMGNVEVLEALCDWHTAHGVSMEAGRYVGPGTIHHLIHEEPTWLGPSRAPAEAVEWLAALLNASGLPTTFAADPRGAIWSKFIFNSVQNPTGAIVLGVNAARFQCPEMRDLIDAMFAEAIRVAEAQGIALAYDPASYVNKVRAGELPMTQHAGSMAADLAAGRELEIEAMTGYLVRKAKSLGVPVPVTETVYRLCKGVEFAARVKREAAAK